MKLLFVFTCLWTIITGVFIPNKDDKAPNFDPNPFPLNASLVSSFPEPFDFDLLPVNSRSGPIPAQWPIANLRKRQNCIGNSNYCFPSAPGDSCACNAICCTDTVKKVGWCCTTTYVCDIPNSRCKEATVTTSTILTTTSTIPLYKTTISSIGATTTKLQIITSVSVITISSANTATVVGTVTISSAIQKRAQGVIASNPANVALLPSKTPIAIAQESRLNQEQNIIQPPQITPQPTSPDNRNKFRLHQKRTVTSTIVVSTVTVYVTSTVNVFSVASYLVTVSSSTTIWLTSTTVLNAQKTVYTTTTINIAKTTDNVQTAAVQTSTAQSATFSTSSNNNNNNNNNNNVANKSANESSNKSTLSTGAKIGIGIGAAIAFIALCLLLACLLRRRSKRRKVENQAMIDEAVAAAIASNNNAAVGSPQEKRSANVSPYPVVQAPSPTAFHQQPGYAQYGQGIAGARAGADAGGYHGYPSPEMPAEPVQHSYELAEHSYSPPPPPEWNPRGYGSEVPYRG